MMETLDGPVPPGRQIYCNRTLNLRAIKAIGYDMDYTLIHYNVDEWERCAYEALRDKLVKLGWPVGDLQFDPRSVTRGLILDLELGNVVKANRFGYVKRAAHGGEVLSLEAQRRAYSRTVIDLGEPRWAFLNTFFSISEACIYSQLVDMLDSGALGDAIGYADLYRRVRFSLDEAHMEGQLKDRILAEPDRFVEHDELTIRALRDQARSGKKLLLITNSEWSYTSAIMTYAFDRFLPGSMTWRDLFDLIVVSARKPEFFDARGPIFEVVDEEGLLRPVVGGLGEGRIYLGGNASQIERGLDIDGSEILFVGDHIYSDVHVSKGIRRWRTAVIIRELEDEVAALHTFAPEQQSLDRQMDQKVRLEAEMSKLRLELQRRKEGVEPTLDGTPAELDGQVRKLRERLVALDEAIAPIARKWGKLTNPSWGMLMRTGNDKSHLARQVERHADIYTSRVSNFAYETPFAYFRSKRGSLPHDIDD